MEKFNASAANLNACAYFNHNLYLILGGKDILVYNPVSNEWLTPPRLPHDTVVDSVNVVASKLLIFSFANAESPAIIHELDETTRMWNKWEGGELTNSSTEGVTVTIVAGKHVNCDPPVTPGN